MCLQCGSPCHFKPLLSSKSRRHLYCKFRSPAISAWHFGVTSTWTQSSFCPNRACAASFPLDTRSHLTFPIHFSSLWSGQHCRSHLSFQRVYSLIHLCHLLTLVPTIILAINPYVFLPNLLESFQPSKQLLHHVGDQAQAIPFYCLPLVLTKTFPEDLIILRLVLFNLRRTYSLEYWNIHFYAKYQQGILFLPLCIDVLSLHFCIQFCSFLLYLRFANSILLAVIQRGLTLPGWK